MNQKTNHYSRICLAGLFIASLVAGCKSPIHVDYPVAGQDREPVPEVEVSFSPKLHPADRWIVELNGVLIKDFSPAPKAGGMSRAPLVFPDHKAAHWISARASCGAACNYDSQRVDFQVPVLLYNTTIFDLKPANIRQFAAPAAQFVGVQLDRTVPIKVTITETSATKIMRLGTSPATMQPFGTPITVTIPPGSTKANFFIESNSVGEYFISFTAAGTSPGFGTGKVFPP